MEIDLTEIGMQKGMQYETIITTYDIEGNLNAAPIGVLCKGRDNIMCRIFKGSTTLDNIISQREFTVNITENPLIFTWSLLDNLEKKDFCENGSLKNADAYFKCEVTDLKEAVKQSDPVRKKSEGIVIIAKAIELKVKKPVKVFNRSFSLVLESLDNLSRLDTADENQRQYYLKSFAEAYRIVKKVGSKKEKEAMDKIKSKMNEKGFEI